MRSKSSLFIMDFFDNNNSNLKGDKMAEDYREGRASGYRRWPC